MFLSDIMTASKYTCLATLVHKQMHRGTLKVRADVVVPSFDNIKFHCYAELNSKRFLCCGVDNPYFLIERARIDENFKQKKLAKDAGKSDAILDLDAVVDWVRIYQSKHLFNNKNPWWEPVQLLMTNLCSNNKLLPLRISVCCFANSG